MSGTAYNDPKLALNRIYTKRGDSGETSLVNGRAVPKDHAKIEAYGTIDELNAFVGAACVTAQELAPSHPAIAPLADILVESCMTHGLYVCRPDDDVAKAERLMSERQVHRIPVVDRENLLVGIVSVSDLARQFARELRADGMTYLAEELVQTMAAISRRRQDRTDEKLRS